MSIAALLKGVEKRLRSADVFNDQPEADIGKWIGMQPSPGRPAPNFGQTYLSIHWGGGKGNDRNPTRHDVYNGVIVTLTGRLGYSPRDRQGIRLASVGDFYDLVDRIIAPQVIHGNWLTTFQYANEFIEGTQQWIDIHNPDGARTADGYMETLVLGSFGPERAADAGWVGGETAPKDVFVTDIRFELARRIQSNE